MKSFIFVKLNGKIFVVKTDSQVEVIEVPNMIKVPQMPQFLRGIILQNKNLIPVIDLAAKLNMPKHEFSVNSCLILLTETIFGKELKTALLADAIHDVKKLSEDNLKIEKGIPFNDFFMDVLNEGDNDKYFILKLNDLINEPELLAIDSSVSEASI